MLGSGPKMKGNGISKVECKTVAEVKESAEVAEVAEGTETTNEKEPMQDESVDQIPRPASIRSVATQTEGLDVPDNTILKLGELVIELSNHLAKVCTLLVEQKKQVAELTIILHESDVKMMRLLNVPKEVKRLRYSMDYRCYCHNPKCKNYKSKGKRK